MKLWHELQNELDARAAAHLARELKCVPDGALDLASNDYLGLARHSRVIEAARSAAAKFGTGARASRLVSGHYDLVEELETELAHFKNCEAALVFSSGYAANIGVIAALANDDTALFCHKRNHASLLDACELAKAPTRFWETNEKLRSLLQNSDSRRKLIVCDGVFSMDGDVCDLPAIVALAEEFDALILLDDAHGTGTLGKTGRGTAEHFGIERPRLEEGASPAEPEFDERFDLGRAVKAGLAPSSNRMRRDCPDWKKSQVPPASRIVTLGTLSKALGSQGGFVCGPRVLVDYLIGAARSFIYSTGLNPPAVGAALMALRIIQDEPERVQKCRDIAAFLASELGALGYDVAPQSSPILAVFAENSANALQLSARLLERGLWCPAIRPPTVKRARLRLTSNASWDDETLARIVNGFGECN